MKFSAQQFHPQPFASPFFHHRKVGPRAAGGFTVSQLVEIYGGKKINRVSSSTPLIAIIELGGGYKPSDNATAFSSDNLPPPTINNYSINGANNSPGDDADGEVALDIQVAAKVYSALTGEAAKLAMIWSPNTDTGFATAVAKAGQLGAVAASASWGAPESQWSASSISGMGNSLQANQTAGCATFAASGDNDSGDGISGNNVDFPASHPLCLGCGGTSLMVSGQTYSEKVWNDGRGSGTGGGLSKVFTKPSYQAALIGSARGVPDVSAAADPDTGYRIFLDGQWGIIGGTSAVAPFYAGLLAAFVAGRVSTQNLVNRLYAASNAFQDITVGSNGSFKAQVGYDCCTGLGSLKIATLFTALGGVPVTPPTPIPVPPVPIPPVPPPTTISPTTLSVVFTGSVSSITVGNTVIPVPTPVNGKAISMDLQTTLLQLISDLQVGAWFKASKDAALLYAEVVGMLSPTVSLVNQRDMILQRHAMLTTDDAILDCTAHLKAAASAGASFDFGSLSPILVQLLTLLLTKLVTPAI